MRPSVPRAASSHSASEGSRCPRQRQYAPASNHVTWVTGAFGRDGGFDVAVHAPAATQRA